MNEMFIILAIVFIISYIDTLNLTDDRLAEAYKSDYRKYLTKLQFDMVVYFAVFIISALFTVMFWSVSEIIAQIISVIGWH